MTFVLDITTVAISLGVIAFLNVWGYKIGKALLNLSAGMLGVYMTAQTFNASGITMVISYNATSNTFSTFVVDPNIYAIIFAILTIVSLTLVMAMRIEHK